MTIPSPILPHFGTSGSIQIIQCIGFPICKKDATYSQKWWASTKVFLESVQRVFWHIVNTGYISTAINVAFIMLKIIKIISVSVVKIEQNIKALQYECTFPKHSPPQSSVRPYFVLPLCCLQCHLPRSLGRSAPPTLIHPERVKPRVPSSGWHLLPLCLTPQAGLAPPLWVLLVFCVFILSVTLRTLNYSLYFVHLYPPPFEMIFRKCPISLHFESASPSVSTVIVTE